MSTKQQVLIVDDEHSMRDFLQASLAARFTVHTASNVSDAMAVLQAEKIDLVLSDVQMPGRGGLDLLEDISAHLSYMPTVIMMTAFGTIEGAVQATTRGAVDYLTKPFGLDQLNHVLDRSMTLDRLQKENVQLRRNLSSRSECQGLLGNNVRMAALRDKIQTIADSRGTVLLQGESGTGKEVVARAIHNSGCRAEGPFIRINCSAIPDTLLESELFGHEKGAFTGAVQSRKGKFELADGGTLLLDEISEMPFPMQAKLLRVLQEREFMKLGSKETTRADVRIIATTNRNLKDEIKAGNFREDLFFRLNVIPIQVAPLRQRKDDIPLLADYFCRNFCSENGKELMEISPDAMRALIRMDWPGNVRQLQNVIERAVILGKGSTLDVETLDLADEMDGPREEQAFHEEMTLKDMEQKLILRKLQTTRGNRTQAAQELGISVRTLRNKLNLYTDQGVEIPG